MDTHRPTRHGEPTQPHCQHGSARQSGAEPLTVLAHSVESLHPEGSPPAWAEIIGPTANPTHVRWHNHPDTLMGFVAPAECHAIAVVSSGWAANLTETPPSDVTLLVAPGERRRCRVVFIMTRTGETAGYLRAGADIVIDEAPTVGRVPDLVRRCLDLPTAAPEESTAGLLARLWLTNIAAAQRDADPLTWPSVARLHPALQAATEAGITIAADQIIAALTVAADAWSWTHLAAQAAEPGWLADLLPAAPAGWMDEGILSRWLLNTLAPIDSLLEHVTPRLSAAAAVTLRTTLHQLDAATTA